jgi:hypothetical protein
MCMCAEVTSWSSALQVGPEFSERLSHLTSTDKQVRREVSGKHRVILSTIFWDIIPCSPSSVSWGLHLLARWFLAEFLRPWRWRRYVPPKLRLTLNGLHSVVSQKMVPFITTVVKTSNPTASYPESDSLHWIWRLKLSSVSFIAQDIYSSYDDTFFRNQSRRLRQNWQEFLAKGKVHRTCKTIEEYCLLGYDDV